MELKPLKVDDSATFWGIDYYIYRVLLRKNKNPEKLNNFSAEANSVLFFLLP